MAAVVHVESALEFDFVILPGVILRGSTLHIRLRSGRREAPGGGYRVNIGDADVLFVSLVLRKLRAFDNHVRQVVREP